MRNLLIFTLGILSVILFSACHSNHEHGDINLDDGNKWQVNAEMTPHIERAHAIFIEFKSQENSDYRELANDLEVQNTKLIKSCNMKGQSHDELHKWLHPHMKLIEDLKDADSPDEAQPLIAQLEQSFQTYHMYFE